MRKILTAVLFCLFSSAAFGAAIDPSTTEFPWMNGPARDSRYKLSDFPNRVHVWEAYSITCSWCARNSDQVKAMAAEYANDERVGFLDLGLDSRDSDFTRWIDLHHPTYPVVKDVNRAVWNALTQENGIPQTFVTACDGTLVGFTIGYWDSAAKTTLRNAIETAKETVCQD